ncbi:AaceriADL008Wp [[Ashbya] aceris (nom. inval.)]|nr:AaceriADL008Wp [[Ashbya] aceris (nom. inval.)]
MLLTRACIYISLLAGRVLSTGADTPAVESAQEQEKMPDPLTTVDFSSTLASGLHLVEFYSPLCHHCMTFAPIWEKTWKEFHKKGAQLGISMVQVNCLESGDLCKEQNVGAYPTIRLYGPSGYIKDFPITPRDQESLMRFMMAEARNENNMKLMQLESKSTLLANNQFKQFLESGVELPTLISFWPAPEAKDITKITQFRDCRHCAGFQNTWKLLSNRADAEGISTFHFSCYMNGDLCRRVGLDRLTKPMGDRDRIPALALLLPNVESPIFYERDSYDFENALDFVLRSHSNYLTPPISPEEIAKMLVTVPRVSNTAEEITGKTVIVYNPAAIATAKEASKISQTLVKQLDRMPNVYLHKFEGQLKKNIDRMLDRAYTMLLEKASKDTTGLNKDLFHLRTLSMGEPIFIMFKESSRVPIAFLKPKDQVDLSSKALQWIKENACPVLNEITDVTLKALLKRNEARQMQIVIQILDTGNEQELKNNNYMEDFFGIISKVEVTRDEYIYKELSRLYGPEIISDAASGKSGVDNNVLSHINEKLTENYNGVLYGYLDKARKKAFKRLGLNVHATQVENGDVLIVDGKGKFYYANDIHGNRMTVTSPETVIETIKALLYNKPGAAKKTLRKFLIGSPFGHRWQFLDYIHQYGFLGWLLLIITVCLSLRLPRTYKKYIQRKKYAAKHDTIGILGKERAFPE